jgi:hypothetical protein
MRGRRRRAPNVRVSRASGLVALEWVEQSSTRDELESLILAQNERWRHA